MPVEVVMDVRLVPRSTPMYTVSDMVRLLFSRVLELPWNTLLTQPLDLRRLRIAGSRLRRLPREVVRVAFDPFGEDSDLLHRVLDLLRLRLLRRIRRVQRRLRRRIRGRGVRRRGLRRSLPLHAQGGGGPRLIL